jgi:hypothetical protein
MLHLRRAGRRGPHLIHGVVLGPFAGLHGRIKGGGELSKLKLEVRRFRDVSLFLDGVGVGGLGSLSHSAVSVECNRCRLDEVPQATAGAGTACEWKTFLFIVAS